MTTRIADILRTVARDAIFSDWRGRSFALATAYWLMAIAAAGAVTSFAREPVLPPTESHGALSLDLAVNAAWCGTSGRLSNSSSPLRLVGTKPDLIDQPIRELLAQHYGSIPAYCATVTTPFIHNENSLRLFARALLIVNPDASARWLGRALSTLRLLVVLLFALVMSWAGASLWLTIAFTVVADVVLKRVGMELSVYSFLAVLPLTAVAFYTATLRAVTIWRPWTIIATGLAAGWLTGIGANLRSSYLPIFLTIFIAWLGTVLYVWNRATPRQRSPWRVAVGAILAFAAAFIAFDVVMIRPLLPPADETNQNYAYHSVAHSLVLGVATPTNPFAEGLGIAWDDQVGYAIARKVNPEVTYLGPGYETALFKYYWQLWQQYPREMLALYFFKVRWTGRDILLAIDSLDLPLHLREDRVRRLNAVNNGYILFTTAAGVLALAVWQLVRTRSALAYMFAVVAATAVLVLTESAIIMPTFVGLYHSYLLVFFTLLPAFVVQAALDSTYEVAARFVSADDSRQTARARA